MQARSRVCVCTFHPPLLLLTIRLNMSRPDEDQTSTNFEGVPKHAGARPSPLILRQDSAREKHEQTTDLTPVTAMDSSIKKPDSGEYGSGQSSPDIPIRGVSTLTYLATFACNLIYLAQTWSLVGVGLVRIQLQHYVHLGYGIYRNTDSIIYVHSARDRYHNPVQCNCPDLLANNKHRHLSRCAWAHLLPYRRLLGP